MNQPPIAPTTLILEMLIRMEAKIDQLQQELHTHIAASVAERRDVRAAVAETISAESRRIRGETARLRVQVGRVKVRLRAIEDALSDDPYAELQVREHAA